MGDAAAAYRARVAELEARAEAAEARSGELHDAIEAIDAGLSELDAGETDSSGAAAGGDDPKDAKSASPGKASETEAPAPGGDVPLMIVPELALPEVLKDAGGEDMDALRAEIERILSADEAEMSAEEKAAALSALKQSVSGEAAELDAALEELEGQRAALAASADSLEALEGELADAQGGVDRLSAAIAESDARIAALEAELSALEAQSASDGEAAQAQIEALNAQIEDEQARAAELIAQLEAANARLEAANAELEKKLAELQAYSLSRELTDGEAHAAATLAGEIAIDADGKTARWRYSNDLLSGNEVVLSIEMDGEELYRSEALAPGEAIEQFELSRALEPGEQILTAVTNIYAPDGAFLSATRIPVRAVYGGR